MRLVLMRHGEAVGIGMDPGLTSEGMAVVTAAVAQGSPSWGRVGRILHSPLRRARQTAEQIAARHGAARVATLVELLPGGDVEAAARRIVENAGADADVDADSGADGTVVVVSHLPLLPALHHWMTDRHRDFGTADAVVLSAPRDGAWRGSFEEVV